MTLDLMLHPLSAKVFLGESVKAGILARSVVSDKCWVIRLALTTCHYHLPLTLQLRDSAGLDVHLTGFPVSARSIRAASTLTESLFNCGSQYSTARIT